MKSHLSGDRYHQIRARLHELYPAAFCARGATPVPLKLGIKRDLWEAQGQHGFGRGRIALFLGHWVGRSEYREAVARGGPRYALDGTPAGEVSPEHMAHAAAQIEGKRPAPVGEAA